MLWLPIISLGLAMFVVVSAFALTFFSVAFAGPHSGAARSSFGGWSLPTVKSERLHSWAANLARRVVDRHAHQPRSAETPLAIAAELEAGANAVLEQAAEITNAGVAKTCPDARPHHIAVTAPEVFAITEELERRYSAPERQLIHELAILNARRARFVLAEEFPQAGINCPLRTTDGHCMTFMSRPIACRRLCSSCACVGDGACGATRDGQCDRVPDVADELHAGISDGLSEGLRLAELDDGVYELNDALATALATPQAASRWSHGERVFANCLKA